MLSDNKFMADLDCSKLEIIKADKEILHSIEFDCGDDDLNEFLLEDSFINIDNSLSKIYLCLYENQVIAFFSLSADSIKVNKKLEIEYRTYPAIKIGRLAVHKDFQGMHIGSILIDWVVGFCLELRKDIGIRFISLDAYNGENTLSFYNNNLFEALQPKRMEIKIICRCIGIYAKNKKFFIF